MKRSLPLFEAQGALVFASCVLPVQTTYTSRTAINTEGLIDLPKPSQLGSLVLTEGRKRRNTSTNAAAPKIAREE